MKPSGPGLLFLGDIRILYPEKLSFRVESEIQTFPDKQKLKEFITTKPTSQEMLKEFFKLKRKDNN